MSTEENMENKINSNLELLEGPSYPRYPFSTRFCQSLLFAGSYPSSGLCCDHDFEINITLSEIKTFQK